MKSYYEINVSSNGKHLFATAERSLKQMAEADSLFTIMKMKFPTADGYDVTMTFYSCVGNIIEQ